MKFADFKKQIQAHASFFVAIPALVWQAIFLYVPLFFILSASFLKGWHLGTGFTLDHFRAVVNPLHAIIILKSLLLALCVAGICFLVGYPVAYFFAIRMRRWKNVLLFFLTLPFWTNFLVQAYAWFFVLDNKGFINTTLLKLGIISSPLQLLYTPFAVIVVMVYCYLPFMILPLYGSLEKFDVSLLEASLDLGASPASTFFKVTLPLTLSGIRNGFFLVFVPAFGEYAIPAILGGGKYANVGSIIAMYYLEARNPALGAAFTVLSNIVVLIFGYCMYRMLAHSAEKFIGRER